MIDDYNFLGLRKEAHSYIIKKAQLDKSLNGKISFELAKDYRELAWNFEFLKNYEKAHKYCQKSLKILDKISEEIHVKKELFYSGGFDFWQKSCKLIKKRLEAYN